MAETGLLWLAVICAGIGAGSAYTTYFHFAPAGMSEAAWVRMLQHAIPRIGIPLFVVQPVAALATLGCAVLARDDWPSFGLLALATACFAVAAVVTRAVVVPINQQLAGVDPDALPAIVGELRRRWWTFHRARCAALGLGLASLVLGSLTRT